MGYIESIDPFLMQLFIVPLIVIGLGLLASIIVKKALVAPLITLLLNLLYETWYMKHFFSEINYTSWNIIFPVISFGISWAALSSLKQQNKQN
ncbi:hypothetical protein WAK64_18045 [Bacillus spongiae]|uniref:L-lactate permease n=1 Tax=Bacillus spongiae TaxID=2683610 RepID=A0ABU8HIJ1_9BACI